MGDRGRALVAGFAATVSVVATLLVAGPSGWGGLGEKSSSAQAGDDGEPVMSIPVGEQAELLPPVTTSPAGSRAPADPTPVPAPLDPEPVVGSGSAPTPPPDPQIGSDAPAAPDAEEASETSAPAPVTSSTPSVTLVDSDAEAVPADGEIEPVRSVSSTATEAPSEDRTLSILVLLAALAVGATTILVLSRRTSGEPS